MTTKEMQSIKEFASNLGYVVKDYSNFDEYQKNIMDEWQFLICMPGHEDYECVVDYTFNDSTMFEVMECVDVFFQVDVAIKDDMINWYSHCEELADYPLNKLKTVLISVMKEYKQKKIDIKKAEIQKDFVN